MKHSGWDWKIWSSIQANCVPQSRRREIYISSCEISCCRIRWEAKAAESVKKILNQARYTISLSCFTKSGRCRLTLHAWVRTAKDRPLLNVWNQKWLNIVRISITLFSSCLICDNDCSVLATKNAWLPQNRFSDSQVHLLVVYFFPLALIWDLKKDFPWIWFIFCDLWPPLHMLNWP